VKTIHAVPIILSAGLLAALACNTATAPVSTSIYSDSTLTADVAATSGDAVATLPSSAVGLPSGTGNTLGYTRTRTCYDGSGAVVPGCSPLSSVRQIVTHVSLDGSRSFSTSTTGGTTISWSGAIHRVADDTMTRNFNSATPPVEVSRTHGATATGHDTTSFAGESVTRFEAEAAHDRVNGVTWDLPRSTNPFPVSGSITRVDSVHATFTKGTLTETRDVVRTVEVDFPPDAQGNAVLKINGKTCTLNLVTHAVVNCH